MPEDGSARLGPDTQRSSAEGLQRQAAPDEFAYDDATRLGEPFPAAPAEVTLLGTDASPLFATIVEEAFSEIIVFDVLTLQVLLVNARARRNLGYSASDIPNMVIDDIKPGQNVREAARSLMTGATPRSVSRGKHRRKDGSTYPVEEYSQIVSFGGRPLVFQTIVDQTDLARLEAQADFLSYIELDASSTSNSDEFMCSVLRRVARYLDCSAGHALYWDPQLKAMTSSGLWHFGPTEPWHSRVRETAEGSTFHSNCGIPGRVYAEKTTVFGRRLGAEDWMFAFRPAVDAPSEPVLAIPIFARNDVSAVMEFYSTGRIDRDRLQHGLIDKISMQVSRLFERKRVDEDLAEARDLFSAAVRSANVGVWDYNHRTGKSYMSDRVREILGFNESPAPTDWKSYLDRIHPDDTERRLVAMTAHMVHRAPYDVEYRVRRPSGEYVWIRARAQGVWDERGAIVRSIGTLDDITASKEAELVRQDIMTLLAGNLNTSTKICAALERACRYLRLPNGVVSHITDNIFEVLYSFAPTSPLSPGTKYPLNQTLCSDVLFGEDVRAIPDLDLSPLKAHPGRETLPTAAYLGVSYFVNGVRFGTICFFSSASRDAPFLETEIAIMRLLALWVGDLIGRDSYIASLVDNDLRKTANLPPLATPSSH